MPRGGIREKINNIGRGPRERCRSVPRGVPPSRSFTCAIFFSRGFVYRSSFFAPKPHENACYAGYGGPREQCRSVPRGGVKKEKREKKMIGRGPRERCIAIPRFGINNALQGRKERNSKGVWERAESRGLRCFN